MTAFQRSTNLVGKKSARLFVTGNIKNVTSRLKSLSYIFGNRSIADVSRQEVATVVNAIETLKSVKFLSEFRRRQCSG